MHRSLQQRSFGKCRQALSDMTALIQLFTSIPMKIIKTRCCAVISGLCCGLYHDQEPSVKKIQPCFLGGKNQPTSQSNLKSLCRTPNDEILTRPPLCLLN